MFVGPSFLSTAPGGKLICQEESQESSRTQVPSTEPRLATRDRDAAVPLWAWFLLIPIVIALAALVLFRRRGYNPNQRLDLRTQPEGARYREKKTAAGGLPVAASSSGTSISEEADPPETDDAAIPAHEGRAGILEDDELDGDFDIDPENGLDSPEADGGDLDDSWLEEDSPAFTPSYDAPVDHSGREQFLPFESMVEAAAEKDVLTAVTPDNEELIRLRKESHVLQEELASIRGTLERVQAGHSEALSAADEKLHLLQSEIEIARSASRDALAEADDLKGQLSRLRQRNENQAAELVSNRDDLAQLRDGAERAEQEMAAARIENDQLRQKIAAMERELQLGEQDRRTLTEQIGELTSANRDTEARYQEVRNKLDAVTARWKENQQTADGMTTSELLDKLNEKRKMLHLVQEKLREKLVLIEEMKREKPGRRSGKS